MCVVSLKGFRCMVQNVIFFNSLVKAAPNLGRAIKKSSSPSSNKNFLLPLALSAFSLFLLNKNKCEKKDDVFVKEKGQLENTTEYSAWARLKDLGSYRENIDCPVVSKDSNKWNQVFRS